MTAATPPGGMGRLCGPRRTPSSRKPKGPLPSPHAQRSPQHSPPHGAPRPPWVRGSGARPVSKVRAEPSSRPPAPPCFGDLRRVTLLSPLPAPPAQPHPRGAEEGLTTSSAPEPHPKAPARHSGASALHFGKPTAQLWERCRGGVGAQQSRKGLNHGAPCGLRSPHRLQDRAATRSRHPRKKRAHVEVTFPSATAHLGRSREKRSHITQRRCSDRPLLIPSLQPPALAAAPRRSSSRCLSPNPPNPPRSGLHAVPLQTPQHPAPLGTIEPPRLEEAPAPPDISARPSAAAHSHEHCWRCGLQTNTVDEVCGQRSLWSTRPTVRYGLLSTWSTAKAVYV